MLWRDGVDVIGAAKRGDAEVILVGVLHQCQHQVASADWTSTLNHCI